MTSETTTMDQFIQANGLKAKIEFSAHNPNMEETHPMRHYRVQIQHGRKRMTTYFSTGMGWTQEPSLSDVLDCLARDSSGIEQSFEAWAGEYGYDADSRKAESIYKTCKRQAKKLKNRLGHSAFEGLLYGVERL